MNSTLVIAMIVILALVALAALFLVGRSKPAAAPPREGNGIVDSGAAAVEDVAGPLFGVDAHPYVAGPIDDLTVLKGLGPKAAAQLNALGIHRFAQLAALDPDQALIVDARMGVFKGRLNRDRWIDQARLLASGDREEFEEVFGKLGS